ncbi:MAG: hypothetical protein J5525_13295 [Lachnospiraceae bacterium]|nr:hypothetical protein [Lachnospiraceae bacterium]
MASFICNILGESYFVDKEAYGFQAAMRVKKEKSIPGAIEFNAKPIQRFITVDGKYIDLEDGDKNDTRPIMIAEFDAKEGKIISYAKEFGLNDPNKLYPV